MLCVIVDTTFVSAERCEESKSRMHQAYQKHMKQVLDRLVQNEKVIHDIHQTPLSQYSDFKIIRFIFYGLHHSYRQPII